MPERVGAPTLAPLLPGVRAPSTSDRDAPPLRLLRAHFDVPATPLKTSSIGSLQSMLAKANSTAVV